MKNTSFAIAFAMLALCVVPTLAQDEPVTRGQEQDTPPPPVSPTPEQLRIANGTEVTRRLLHELHFKPLSESKDYDADPPGTLVVVMGALKVLPKLDTTAGGRYGRLESFLKRGGAVLIASNLPPPALDLHSRNILERLGGVVFLPDRTRIATRDIRKTYKENLDCPFIVPKKGNIADELFVIDERHLDRVATNQPSAFWRGSEGNFSSPWPPVLASFPAWQANVIPDHELLRHPEPCFMVGASYTQGGKLLLLADHGVFINMMMLPHEIDNLPFAMKTFTWLREGPNGQQRHQALFFEENGSVSDLFEVPLRHLPTPDFPEIKPEDLPLLIGQADRILSGLESENVFDTYLARSHNWRQGPELWGPIAVMSGLILLIWISWRLMGPGLLGPLAFGVGLILSIWGSWRLMGPGPWGMLAFVSGLTLFSWGTWRLIVWRWTIVETGLPTLNLGLAGHTPLVSTLTDRQRTLLRSGNLWEPAHALARETFARIGLTVAPDRAPMPRFVARGGFWARRALLARVRKLRLLAFGPPRRISAAAWTRLAVEVEDLSALLQSGEVQIEGATRHETI